MNYSISNCVIFRTNVELGINTVIYFNSLMRYKQRVNRVLRALLFLTLFAQGFLERQIFTSRMWSDMCEIEASDENIQQ